MKNKYNGTNVKNLNYKEEIENLIKLEGSI